MTLQPQDTNTISAPNIRSMQATEDKENVSMVSAMMSPTKSEIIVVNATEEDPETPRKRLKTKHDLPTPSSTVKVSPRENPPRVEMKGTKLVFHISNGGFASHSATMLGIVAYRQWRSDRTDTSLISELPSDLLDLIARLVQDSDTTLPTLAKRIKDVHLAHEGDSSTSGLTNSFVEETIKSLATREYFGVSKDVLASLDPAAGKTPPPSVAHYVWMVNDLERLTEDMRELAEQRRTELEELSQAATSFFLDLSADEKLSLITKKPKTTAKPTQKAENTKTRQLSEEKQRLKEEKAREQQRKAEEKEEKQRAKEAKEQVRLEKQQAKEAKEQEKQQIKEAKEQEKADKKRKRDEDKAAKVAAVEAEKAEKQRFKEQHQAKLDAKRRAQPSLGQFFAIQTAPKTKTPEREISAQSDWDAVVMPFFVKPNVEVAPTNRWKRPVIEAFEQHLAMSPSEREALGHSPTLSSFLDTVSPAKRRRRGRQLLSVRDLMQQASESMVIDGDADPLDAMKDPRKVKIKILRFAEDTRPSYVGTWTKASRKVNGRQPLGQAAEIDYDYDSEAEWIDEEDGEDLNDDEDIGSEADTLMSEDERQDMEDWVAPDDEVDRSRASSPSAALPRRKMVGRLTPYVKGPFFEETFGTSPYIALDAFRIDILIPQDGAIDPFKVDWPETSGAEEDAKDTKIAASKLPKPPMFTDSEEVDFIKAIHGNTRPLLLIVPYLKEKFPAQSKRALEIRLKEIAVRTGKATNSQWHVKPEHRSKAIPSNPLLELQAE